MPEITWKTLLGAPERLTQYDSVALWSSAGLLAITGETTDPVSGGSGAWIWLVELAGDAEAPRVFQAIPIPAGRRLVGLEEAGDGTLVGLAQAADGSAALIRLAERDSGMSVQGLQDATVGYRALARARQDGGLLLAGDNQGAPEVERRDSAGRLLWRRQLDAGGRFSPEGVVETSGGWVVAGRWLDIEPEQVGFVRISEVGQSVGQVQVPGRWLTIAAREDQVRILVDEAMGAGSQSIVTYAVGPDESLSPKKPVREGQISLPSTPFALVARSERAWVAVGAFDGKPWLGLLSEEGVLEASAVLDEQPAAKYAAAAMGGYLYVVSSYVELGIGPGRGRAKRIRVLALRLPADR